MAKSPIPLIIDGDVVASELLPTTEPDSVLLHLVCSICHTAQNVIPRVLADLDGVLYCPGCGQYNRVPQQLMACLPALRDAAGKGQAQAWVDAQGARYGWLRGLLTP